MNALLSTHTGCGSDVDGINGSQRHRAADVAYVDVWCCDHDDKLEAWNVFMQTTVVRYSRVWRQQHVGCSYC
jgi:hypothetical protein